ncbi:glycoside hydrolase family 113 [Natronincola ferrireducens]|uniref:Uncharacterized protein n=1 Tax=Natronincola ferrireducens TaxID=393762 RepID=A0A1G8X867_9FIRM|nr:hypothetical protein [Natronincola ferrireducens]SDJ86577.1 hypothetical protein SAMN05660472_00141 [Natronincola ferrireducens]
MSRNILISILSICIVFMFYFILDKLQTIDFNQGDESNKDPIDLTDSTASMEKPIGSQYKDEGEDVVDRKYQRGEFQAGINLLVYDQPNMSNATKLFKRLRNLGINSVAIVYPFVQSDWQADQVMIDPIITPDIEALKELILLAHAEDLSVMLRPILDEKTIMASGHWRGTIMPQNPQVWFDSYRALLLPYAELAQKTNVEIFNIGTELNSLQHNKYSDEWLRLILEIREVYQGKLIYSFNWDSFREIPLLEFVPMLDHVGIDAYFPLDAPDDAGIEDLKEAWEEWMSQIKDILNNQSVVITEVGVIPVAGAYRKPYIWSMPGGRLDWQAQANYYEATYSVWRLMSEGVYWWMVDVDEYDSNSIGFSPLGTPTEDVLKQIFLKKTPEDIRD